MTLKTLFLLVLSLALLPKVRHVEPKYDINRIQKANDCPPYSSERFRILARILGCNDNKPMHCAQLLGSKEFTARCLTPKYCTQGQQPFIQDGSDTVSCRFCYGDTYNRVPSQPSYSYSECTPMTELTKGRILCKHLGLRTSDPDYHNYNRYIRCNVSAGYILDDQSVSDPSRDRQGYCTNATDPRCIKYSCEGLELIKNYSCVKNCSSDEYRAGDQTCVKRQTGQTPGPLTTPGILTTPGRPLVTIDRSSTQLVTQATEPMKSESTDNSKIIIITLGVVLLVMTVVVAGYLFYCWKRVAKDQYIGMQVIHVHPDNQGKEREKTKDEKASEENRYSDGDHSQYNRPIPETGADDQRSHQLNRDNGVNQDNLDKRPCPETGADDQQSHQRNRDNGVNQDNLGPSPSTLRVLMDKLQHVTTWEEKVDAIFNLFGQLHKEERNRWEVFSKYCIWIHEHVFLANMLPRLPHERSKPTITQITYRNTPEGFTAFESSGRQNSCLYQSVSLLLVGDESQYKLLRLMTTVFAARNFATAAKQIMELLKCEDKDVHLFYSHHLRAYNELRAKEQHEQSVEEWNKIYLQELIMDIPVLNTMSSQIHAMFLCGAIGMPIHQHLQAGHGNYLFRNQLDPKVCFSDKIYDESLPELNIMWVNSENDLNKEINHVVPLWKEEKEKSHCVGQSTEVTATKVSMVTLEDEKHNIETSDGDSENDDESNADNNENYAADNVEKEPFIPAGSMPL